METSAELISRLTGYIRDGVPFTFVKKGDGEEFCLAGATGRNCDGHPYSRKLAAKLKCSFAFLEAQPSVRVVHWNEQMHYQVLLHHIGIDTGLVREFWRAVRESDQAKMFVGPWRLRSVASLLQAKHVEVPLVDAFSFYEIVRRDLLTICQSVANPSDPIIVVFSAGMPAKCWIADVLKKYPQATCIDAGSSFDPIFVGETRDGQLPQNEVRDLYSEWL